MKFSDIATITVGQILTRVELSKKETSELRYTVLHPKAISNGAIIDESLEEIISSKKIGEDKITKSGDVVIKLSTPYEAVVIDENHADLLIPSFCAVFRSSTDINPYYLCALINSSYIRDKISSKIAGTIRPMVRISDLRSIEIPEVSVEQMELIGQEYELSLKKRDLLQKMLRTEIDIMDNKLLKVIMEVDENEK